MTEQIKKIFPQSHSYLLKLKDKDISIDKVYLEIEDFVKNYFLYKYFDKKENKEKYNPIITTTQLRNIYAKLISIQNVNELKMLCPNLMYIAARQQGKQKEKAKETIMYLIDLIKNVKDEDENELYSFKKIMEAIVAYHKFYNSTNQ